MVEHSIIQQKHDFGIIIGGLKNMLALLNYTPSGKPCYLLVIHLGI